MHLSLLYLFYIQDSFMIHILHTHIHTYIIYNIYTATEKILYLQCCLVFINIYSYYLIYNNYIAENYHIEIL